MQEYTHLPLGEENRSVSGYFVLEKESRLSLDGREVLYAVGTGVVDTSCCGMGGCRYALVPGFIVDWHVRQNQDGLWISQVESVSDPALQKRISHTLQTKELTPQVNFL